MNKKTILKKIINCCERVGRARAAAVLCDLGYYTQARQLMLQSAQDTRVCKE
jgi:hypothetical protein